MHHTLGRDTEETEMVPSLADCHTGPRKTDLKSCRAEPVTYHLDKHSKKPAKRWENDLNEFVKDEATETTQSNDLINNNS